MTWESANPFAVVDVECKPQRVVTRYETAEEAEWFLEYLSEHGGDAAWFKVDRGGYVIDASGPKNPRRNKPEKVAKAAPVSYTRRIGRSPTVNTTEKRKVATMPPRGKRAAAVVEPEVVEPEEQEGGQFDHHLTKTLSPTMTDYANWFHENVADIAVLGAEDPDRLLALGSTLYPHFQKSDFNQANRAARKAERSKAAPEPEPEEEPEAPVRKGRAASKPAAPAAAKAAPARRGRTAKSDAAPY